MSRVLLFVPAYNCAPQIGRVLAQLTPEVLALLGGVVVVDNRSTDGTADAATEALRRLAGAGEADRPRVRLLRNDENVGLGGSHKVAIQLALDEGFEHVVVLHGDDQADVRDVVPLLQAGVHHEHDALLGSRFMAGSRLRGYSRVRVAGNHVFNVLFSLAARRRLLDLGSGLNVLRTSCFAGGEHLRLADDLTFNYYLILLAARRGWRLHFFPISWREEDQRSNVKMAAQSRKMLRLLGQYVRAPDATVSAPHGVPGRRYTSTALYDSAPP